MPDKIASTRGRGSGSRQALPTASRPGRAGADLTVDFAAALRHAQLEAGDPPLRSVARRAGFSAATISRAFGGKKLPRWEVAERILESLGIHPSRINTEWQMRWYLAREEHRAAMGSQPGQNLAASPVCEACGGLIGDLVQHQAWHWRIERLLGGATLRAIEGPGQ